MQNVVGAIASKENFLYRSREIDRIMRNLESGANIQLAAPRRVGKSSILHYFLNTPIKGFIFMYVDVESARSKQEFYWKLYREAIHSQELNDRKNLFKQLTDKAAAALKRLKGLKIGGVIEIDYSNEMDYEEELLNLLEGIDLGDDRLVIMVDEFPEVLLNIVEDDRGDPSNARSFLQSNRGFRNNRRIQGKVQFIYTGSNSLNATAMDLGSTELINDLPSMPVYPLTVDEARELLTKVLKTYSISIGDDELSYAIEKVEWLTPFYFQLMIQELIDIIGSDKKVTIDKIDDAILLISHPRNNNHFHHYIKRIKRVFGEDRMGFVTSFLNELAREPTLTKAHAINLAEGKLSEQQLNVIFTSLEMDGYIVQVKGSAGTYKFNSPILKNWWNSR